MASTARRHAEGGVAVEVRNLSHRYETSEGSLVVLDDVTFSIPPGGHVALTGASGAGKTTLLSILGGLESPQSGHVHVGGHDLHGLDGDELAAYRRATVGFVFQHFGLLDTLTASENVEVALSLAGARAGARRARARELLAAVGLAERAGHRPGALSGGERQRVAIARALANRSRLVLADEPTGNLDERAATRVLELLEHLPGEQGCTLVVVTHDRAVAQRAPTRLHLVEGRFSAR
ncbi:MAG: ABC transporter ATP-binding protein [Actinobacteria bacterium]|nr:ABC transporter ATP-binding protein [Actinomycetota bacterium]